MKSIKKIVDNLATKARNYLNEAYPVTHYLLQERQTEKWYSVFEKLRSKGELSNAFSILDSISLNITRPYSTVATDVDLTSVSFPFIFEVLTRLASLDGHRVYIFDDSLALWKDFTKSRFKSLIVNPSKSGFIEIALVDSEGYLIERRSVTLWKHHKKFSEASNPYAPIKKIYKKTNEIKKAVKYTRPIDAIYTWVNSKDPAWQASISKYINLSQIDTDRFEQNDELKYSLRSLMLYAPWINKVYIFSNCSPPEWFISSNRIKWIMHDEVMPIDIMPTFNSHSIETFLSEVPGISEHFIYLNDDFFLASFLRPSDFFSPYGQAIARLEPYGVVPFFEQLCEQGEAEEWQHAAVNGARLLEKRNGLFPTQMHRHAPYAFKKSVFQQLMAEYPKELAATRAARFRTSKDYSFASFLYHHYALYVGQSIETNEQSMIVRHTNFRRFMDKKLHNKMRFFCLNDGGGSSKDPEYVEFKKLYLPILYPFKSEAER